MLNEKWLSLSEYSTKYKVSVSTLRRRIKSKKVNCVYEDGKYFLENKPLSGHRLTNTNGDLTHHQNITPKAASAPPQNISSFEGITKSEYIPTVRNEKATTNEVSANVHFMVKELKNAYTLNLKEKEEQILTLKDEVTDLKMLVHALEQENEVLKKQKSNIKKDEMIIENINPQPIELEYIPTPTIELANDWLEEDI